MELDFELLKSGCCGMAGAFGFEEDHYDVSMNAAERVLLPAIRQAPEDALIVTNGFSCAEQIRAGTGVRPLHVAEVLHEAVFRPQRRN
jgi:Fe-S oxidoreductase